MYKFLTTPWYVNICTICIFLFKNDINSELHKKKHMYKFSIKLSTLKQAIGLSWRNGNILSDMKSKQSHFTLGPLQVR